MLEKQQKQFHLEKRTGNIVQYYIFHVKKKSSESGMNYVMLHIVNSYCFTEDGHISEQ